MEWYPILLGKIDLLIQQKYKYKKYKNLILLRAFLLQKSSISLWYNSSYKNIVYYLCILSVYAAKLFQNKAPKSRPRQRFIKSKFEKSQENIRSLVQQKATIKIVGANGILTPAALFGQNEHCGDRLASLHL